MVRSDAVRVPELDLRSAQHVCHPKPYNRRLHRRSKPRIGSGCGKSVGPVPSINPPQFSRELFGFRGLFQGRITLVIAKDHLPGRVAPNPEVQPILRRIDLRPTLFISAQPEIVNLMVARAERAGDLNAATFVRAAMAVKQRSR